MGITDRQKEIVEFIGTFQSSQGFPPSVREVCKGLGLVSPGSLHKHLRTLEKEGFLEGAPGKKRAWKLTQEGWNLIGGQRAPSIPLIGQIAAGTPILAEENREYELPIDPALFGSPDAFALRVRGDSMEEAKILHRDLAIIQPQPEAENGQIVAVLVEGLEPEATLKIFRRHNGTVELHAANRNYEPLIFSGKELSRIKILGKLIGVIRVRPEKPQQDQRSP
jgi:repressor LexA